jgi:N-acetylmuramoyl-L-alanine amidase
VKAELEKKGVDVVLTRSKDVFLPLEARSAKADRLRADAFVSLHLNSSATEMNARGMETYYSVSKSLSAARALQLAYDLPSLVGIRDRRGELLALAVQKAAVAATGLSDRGIKEKSYTVVHHAASPAVLIECGFISNPGEAEKFKTADFQRKLTAGIATGVLSFLTEQRSDPKRGIELPPPPAPLVSDLPPEVAGGDEGKAAQ